MACRGVLFAIAEDVAARLVEARDDDEVMAIVSEIEDAWDRDHLAETDKAWDAMHRALSDGSLDFDAGERPLALAILGGRQLHEGDEYIVSFVPAKDVPAVARALAAIDEAEFRARYLGRVPKDYAPEYGEEDLAYTWGYLREVKELYARAAKEGRAVVFTVDE